MMKDRNSQDLFHTPVPRGSLFLSLAAFLLLVFLLQGEAGADDIYVDGDAPSGGDGSEERPFNSIQKAVDAAEEGDTVHIWAGRYQENVIVDRSLNLMGNSSTNVTVDGDGEGPAMTIQTPWCNLSGCSFLDGGLEWTDPGLMVKANHTVVRNCSSSRSGYGIYLFEAYHCQLLDNQASGNYRAGLYLSSSGENVLAGNNCSGNTGMGGFTGSGIYLNTASGNRLENNRCSGNEDNGITLVQATNTVLESNLLQANDYEGISCQGNTRFNSYLNNTFLENRIRGLEITTEENVLRGNIFSGNGQNFGYGPGTFPDFNYQETVIDESNLVEGKAVYFISDREEFTIDRSWDPGTIYLINCQKVTVRDVDLSGNLRGISLYDTHDSLFENVSVTGCDYAIMLEGGSSGNSIRNCRISGNDVGFFNYNGRNNEIRDSRVTNNRFGLGLYHQETSVVNNSISGNLRGITIQEGLANRMEYNNITENRVGIHFYRYSNPGEGDNNVIRFNSFQGNRDFGVNATDNNQLTVVVANNFWGSPTGPYHPAENPKGLGDNVTDLLDFQPWLAEEKTYSPEEEEETEETLVKLDPLLLGLLGAGLFLVLTIAALSSEALRYYLMKLFSPFYTRLRKEDINQDIESQTTRGRLFQFVQDNPGASFSAVYRENSVGIGTAVYHLSVLQREGYLRSAQQGGRKLFWAKEDYPGLARATLTPTQRAILRVLEQEGALTRTELMERTGIRKTTLHNNLRKLAEAGRVREEEQDGSHLCSLVDT